MNILVQLSHPAHFHYYHYAIVKWMEAGHKVVVAIKTKDILEQLLISAHIPYVNINQRTHRGNKFGILWDMLIRDKYILQICRKEHIDILTGSSAEVAQIGWLLHLPVICTGEDDAAAVPAYARCTYPFLGENRIRLCPSVCNSGRMERYTTHYPSYHELAYLHPNHFTPNREMVEKYGIDTSKPYFVMRFASLNAHHDSGIKGINREIAARLIEILKPHGQIYITSERLLEPEFEPYRIKINPLDMHHVMAFASLYIGDSQTMAAEAGVLGTPFVRYNDFVGRIGYLDELEDPQTKQYVDYLHLDHHYNLGVGIRASEEGSKERLYATVERMVALTPEERTRIYGERREKMLSEKIDYAKFLTWFIENYPSSAKEAKGKNADDAFWKQFK